MNSGNLLLEFKKKIGWAAIKLQNSSKLFLWFRLSIRLLCTTPSRQLCRNWNTQKTILFYKLNQIYLQINSCEVEWRKVHVWGSTGLVNWTITHAQNVAKWKAFCDFLGGECCYSSPVWKWGNQSKCDKWWTIIALINLKTLEWFFKEIRHHNKSMSFKTN